ncbi:hypothetical protein [Verrucosispora sp. TAA-831]|uniref:hypothetical protein n=1 Tax=Verrucosispora sp. TAA-831 TaxID=3422227 RepID=UPI003D6E226B
MSGGPLDGWEECDVPGCPSWDDNADPDEVEAFEDSGWAHGVWHMHLIDFYVVDARAKHGARNAQ